MRRGVKLCYDRKKGFVGGDIDVYKRQSPTHLCLTLIAEYFDSNFGVLVKKTIPVIAIFMVLILGYYLLLTLFL